MPKIAILNGKSTFTSLKSATRMVQRGIAKWCQSGTAIRLIDQDFRVQPSECRALYDAGAMNRTADRTKMLRELRRLPMVMPERMLTRT